MKLEKYLNNKVDLPLLKRFAIASGDSFNKKLDYLIKIAEPEEWNQTDVHTKKTNSTVFYYIIHTFDRLFVQNKIYIDELEENAFFNTGLMTSEGNEIFGHLKKSFFYDSANPTSNYWYFKTFLKSNEKEFIIKCKQKPQIATYYNDFNELYFNPDLDIEINYDHIYEDNIDRLPEEIKTIDQDTAKQIFKAALEFTKKKIKRNNRIPVPQYYNSKLMFLIPVRVFVNKTIVVAVEKINRQYIANTILSMGMAYNCARLLNKPEIDWLFLKDGL